MIEHKQQTPGKESRNATKQANDLFCEKTSDFEFQSISLYGLKISRTVHDLHTFDKSNSKSKNWT